MIFLPLRKATLLLPTPSESNPDLKHLFIILNNPIDKEQLIGLVNITENRRHEEKSCVLTPNDHGFIQKESTVKYSAAQIKEAPKIIIGVQNGIFSPHDPVTEEVFHRICEGAINSPHSPPWLKRLINETYFSTNKK